MRRKENRTYARCAHLVEQDENRHQVRDIRCRAKVSLGPRDLRIQVHGIPSILKIFMMDSGDATSVALGSGAVQRLVGQARWVSETARDTV